MSAVSRAETVPIPIGTIVPEPLVFEPMLVAGIGIGRLPELLAAPLIRSSVLVRVLADHQSEATEAHALYPSRRSLTTKVRELVDSLLQHLGECRTAGRGVLT